jgi:hypothetical protein
MPLTDATLLAHGVGGREDLPIPFSYALSGAVVVLLISFAALGVLWRTPSLRGDRAGAPLPQAVQTLADSAVTRSLLRLCGLAITAFVAYAAAVGPDLANNPTAGFVYVLFWVGLVPLSLLFGPVWRLLNPLRTLHLLLTKLVRMRPEEGVAELPAGLGYWPAAVGLFAFVWLELAAPRNTTTQVLLLFFAVYGAVHLMAAAVFGSRWFDRGDAFEVYSALIGRLSLLGRRCDGRLVLRNPLDGLDGLGPAPGLVATVCVLLGSTAYDGFSNSPSWVRFQQEGPLALTTSSTLGLIGMVLAVAVTYSVAAWLAGVLGHPAEGTRGGLPVALAHSIVPIAVGYLIAHYFSLFVFEGQRTVILASDPRVDGSNLFGTAERGVDYTLISASTISSVQVAAVVTGHLLGVVAAHDRAVRLFPRPQALAGQLPMLVLMVGYTLGGLTLLFAG